MSERFTPADLLTMDMALDAYVRALRKRHMPSMARVIRVGRVAEAKAHLRQEISARRDEMEAYVDDVRAQVEARAEKREQQL